jgi:formylglycine-generating enzyme required for sulfatase activity
MMAVLGMATTGSRLNEFRLLRRLGGGSFGEVWLADSQAPRVNEPALVALKIPHQEEKKLLGEGRKLALLEHANIVRFYRASETSEGLVFLVEEYVPNGDLRARLDERGKLGEEEAIRVAVEMLEALGYLHAHEIIHMDVNPRNILFDAGGRAKLADFGLAKFMESKSQLTQVGGTPGYMAPELYRERVYPASDLWSVAIVLHEMLTGRRPFGADNDAALMYKILREPPALSEALSEGVRGFLRNALAKEVSSRYGTAAAMGADLREVAQGRAGKLLRPDGELSTVTLPEVRRRGKEHRKAEARTPRAVVGVDIEFVRIPAGEFDMGSESGDSDEKPVHRVRISKAFEMGKYPVTQGQWEAVMGSNPSSFKGPDRPVEQVSWNDVQVFLEKLNARGDGYRYRLPTEAEWEYAARAGTTGDSATDADAVTWHAKKSGSQTHPVGQTQANAWGICDMLGNVWEWCQDWYGADYYRKSPGIDPPGPWSGKHRVVRGGSWSSVARDLRASIRNWDLPGYWVNYYGFRCVREVMP